LLLNGFPTLARYERDVFRAFDNEPAKHSLKGQRILVAEENAHMAGLVRQSLLSAGAQEVRVAGDGENALAQLSQFRPDVLVADMAMPMPGGLELVRAVRQAALTANSSVPNPAMPIVVVAAFASRQSVRMAQAAGIDAFVIKPFSIGSLVKRVHRAGRRTAEFIVHPAYVGPDRRSRQRSPEEEAQHAAQATAAAEAEAAKPALRLVKPGDPIPEDASPSLLKMLYSRIQELESEQTADPA
jgi:CheY-like chemotaxis protein